MIKAACLLLALVSVASALPWIWPGFPYYHGYPRYHALPYYGLPNYHHKLPYGQTRLIYYGQFKGSCSGAPDGLYYVDEYSFAYCSNGQKHIQPCAEGSANPAVSHFKNGGYYGLYDFCAVNLVAQGYNGAAKHPVPAHKDDDHYVVENSYVVEENHSDDYKQPKKVTGYENYYQKKTYEEPAKAAY